MISLKKEYQNSSYQAQTFEAVLLIVWSIITVASNL